MNSCSCSSAVFDFSKLYLHSLRLILPLAPLPAGSTKVFGEWINGCSLDIDVAPVVIAVLGYFSAKIVLFWWFNVLCFHRS